MNPILEVEGGRFGVSNFRWTDFDKELSAKLLRFDWLTSPNDLNDDPFWYFTK